MKQQVNNIILTLDAGGTNLVFNAIDPDNKIAASYVVNTTSNNLDEFIEKLVSGFRKINQESENKAKAISFCFPGPADYEKGIIGDLVNLPFFKGGVPLKDILENEFKIPVYINNDGDLFTLGEAMSGLLPYVNNSLIEHGNSRQYRNLFGITLGTGTGGGIVINGNLLIGDNTAGGEINRMSNTLSSKMSIEETLSIRGIMNLYSETSETNFDLCPSPAEIFEIGIGQKDGNKVAAIQAWEKFGIVLGQALANTITLIDGLIVIGGGLAGAFSLFLPKAIETMNGCFNTVSGQTIDRLETNAYNLEDEVNMHEFLSKDEVNIRLPNSKQTVGYSPYKKIGIGVSRLGTSMAVAIGAAAYANRRVSN